MEEIRGIDILVSVNTGTVELPVFTAVGGQRGATLNRSAESIDVTNKVSGSWKRSITGFKEWSIDCDGLFALDDAAFLALEAAFEAGDEVEIQIAKGTELVYSGMAIMTDFPIEAPYDDVATYAVSFTGTGALVKA